MVQMAEFRSIQPPAEAGPTWSRSLVPVAVSVLVAFLCYVASIPFADFQLQTVMMGKDYEVMTLAPFSGWGPHPERFLTPLLAWLVGLSGERYWVFSHLMLIAFLALVHHMTFTKSQNRVWATAFTYGLSLSALVGTYRGLVGYADPTTFVLLCLCIRFMARPWVFWTLLCLASWNHGQAIFLFPWLAYERSRTARLGRLDGVLAAATCVAYFGVRALLTTNDPAKAAGSISGGNLSFAYYWDGMDLLKGLELWVFLVPCVVFSFCFVTIVLLWDLLGEHRRDSLRSLAILVPSICVMLVLAIDIFRFVPLLAFAMIAAMYRRIVPDRRACIVLVAAVALTLAMRQWQLDLVSNLMDQVLAYAFKGHTHPTLTALVPYYWSSFLGYAAFLVLLLVIAHWTLPRPQRQ
jgi:hypothetical protein